jgi:hypothetical protein
VHVLLSPGRVIRDGSRPPPTASGEGHMTMHSEHEIGESSKFKGSLKGNERVSFGTNMALEDESSDGGSSVKIDLVLAMAMDHFHARKFGLKAEKRGSLKVASAGKVKKQKTPVKTGLHGALKTLESKEMEAMLNQLKTEHEDLMEVMTRDAIAESKSKPQSLTGTPKVAHQEK